ncbi:MAG: phosphate ABC transporter permease subunit PstC [Proteobacteria bacterium]|nr:phosphate ABC transporter permease subunit PstC [Pseudomonadota bacterium]
MVHGEELGLASESKSVAVGDALPHQGGSPGCDGLSSVSLFSSTDKHYRLAKWEQRVVMVVLRICAWCSIAITAGIVVILLSEAAPFFKEVSWRDFLFGTQWVPLFEPRSFGVLPIIWGTLLVSVGACFVSVPFGLGIAIFLSEFARPRTRSFLKPLIELLAGIPSVVFGYFALITITPGLQKIFPNIEVFNAFSASIVVGIMTVPMISSLSDDALRAVPRSLREAGYAMGATSFEVSLRVVLPAAISGVIASIILAFSRAIGETMAVTLAAGATPKLTMNFFESIQTMTAYIVQVSIGDTPHGSIEYHSLFAVALVLFLLTLVMNTIAGWVLKKTQISYN